MNKDHILLKLILDEIDLGSLKVCEFSFRKILQKKFTFFRSQALIWDIVIAGICMDHIARLLLVPFPVS